MELCASGFSRQLGLTPTFVVNKHVVELTDSKSIEASHVLFGCKLDLVGQVFDIDLLPNTLVSFDMVVGMDMVIYVSSRKFSAKRKSCVPSPQWGILISLRSS